jgi:hypothetical protein
MDNLGLILFLFSFQCCLFERSHAGAKRDWEFLFGAVPINHHGAAHACTFIDIIRRFVAQSLVWHLAHGGVAVQINILMLDAAPNFFHKDVVMRPA